MPEHLALSQHLGLPQHLDVLQVDLHPDRDKLVQRATAFFSDKTGVHLAL